MSVDTVSTKPKLVAAEPQLFVADINASCAFFTGKLGFSIAFTYGEPPYYAQVKRDGAALNLRCVEGAAIDPAARSRGVAVGLDHGGDRGRDHAAGARFSAGRRELCAGAGEEALGRARFHRQGYRRQSAVVRRTGGVASLSCPGRDAALLQDASQIRDHVLQMDPGSAAHHFMCAPERRRQLRRSGERPNRFRRLSQTFAAQAVLALNRHRSARLPWHTSNLRRGCRRIRPAAGAGEAAG